MEFEPHIIEALKDVRALNDKYDTLSRDRGTHGVRGTFPQMRSIRAQIGALKKQFEKDNPTLKLVMCQAAYGYTYCIKILA